MNLRYVGSRILTFTTCGVGELSPGDEFVVPDDAAAAFLTRADVEQVLDTPAPKAKKRSTTPASVAEKQSVEDPELTTEEVCGVPDDH